jgi:glycosyltransferase involved in cell wall biosynthesis
VHPLISILVPAYNAERYLAETLKSALRQTWPRTEIIVVDDGSTDATQAVARRFESRQVKVVVKRHSGQTATLNCALAEAQGEFVQYLDADDLLAPTKLAVQVTRLMASSRRAIATCAWARFYGDNPSTATFRRYADFQDYPTAIDWLLQSWNGRGTMPPVAWLLPREVVDAAGPWNESLSLNNDTEYFTRVVLNSRRIAYCEPLLGYYRSGNLTLSSNRSRVALESFFLVCELCTAHLLNREDSSRTRQACANLWQHFAYWVYPDAPDLVARAERKVSGLGGSTLRLRGSRAFDAARLVLGWKAARRLQATRLQVAH